MCVWWHISREDGEERSSLLNVVVVGTDSYINDILRSYVAVHSGKSDPFHFFFAPVGRRRCFHVLNRHGRSVRSETFCCCVCAHAQGTSMTAG